MSLANIDSWGIWKSTSCSSRHDKLWDITYTPEMPCVSPGWNSSWICTISSPFPALLLPLSCWVILQTPFKINHLYMGPCLYLPLGINLRQSIQNWAATQHSDNREHYHSHSGPLPPFQKLSSLYRSRGNWTAAVLLKVYTTPKVKWLSLFWKKQKPCPSHPFPSTWTQSMQTAM